MFNLGRHGGLPLQILFLVYSPVFSATKSNTAILAFNEAVEMANAGRCQEAMGAIDRAISADSEFAEAYYLRGVCRYRLKALDGAVMDLGDALRKDPSLLSARSLRAAVHYEAKRFDQAFDDADAVLAKKPDDANALLVRGIIRLNREDRSGATQDLSAYLKAEPDSAMAKDIRAVLAELKGAPAAPVPVAKKKASPPVTTSVKRSSSESTTPATLSASRRLSEEFGRRLLRGEAATVSGDPR